MVRPVLLRCKDRYINLQYVVQVINRTSHAMLILVDGTSVQTKTTGDEIAQIMASNGYEIDS